MSDILNLKLEKIKGFGPVICKKLKDIGIEKLRDLLFYFPFRYEDYTEIKKIKDLKLGEKNVFVGKVIDTKLYYSFKRKLPIFEVLIEDEDRSGIIKATWFGKKYLARKIKKGKRIMIGGKVKLSRKYSISLNSPYFEILEDNYKTFKGKIIPVYHEKKDLTSAFFKYFIGKVKDYIKKIKEYLPEEILEKEDYPKINDALEKIHFPKDLKSAKIAKERFLFENLLYLQLFIQGQKQKLKTSPTYKILPKKEKLIKFKESLEFNLTNSQKKVLREILIDFQKNTPTRRLLQGDVGSGKTIVALISMLNCAENGFQTALMVPTEVLALQHFYEFSKRLKDFSHKICLLTNKFSFLFVPEVAEITKLSNKKLKELIKRGDVKIIIGTHSLISEDLKFFNLAYIVVDEQHRFGVLQRQKIIEKASEVSSFDQQLFSQTEKIKRVPHFLSMSATPIPRTLSLAFYGDLELSRITELPKGRKKIITKIVKPQDREKIYKFVQEQILKGKQIFVICPLIEESEALQVKSAIKEKEYLENKVFKGFKVELIHGRMRSSEKEKIIKEFLDGKIQVLVATPVVEVGINNPNATVIIIEASERFGLATLHQLRGRVGRSKDQGFCFLFMEKFSKKAYKRLIYLTKSNDGFYLAEKDLRLRGPGDFLGERQHGFPDILMEALSKPSLILKAKKWANTILENSEKKEFKNLIKRGDEFQKEVHLE